MSNVILGADAILYFEYDDGGLPEYVMIGGQKGATLSQSTAMHEYTHKGTGGQVKKYLAGTAEWSLSCDGLFMVSDVATEAFMTAYSEKQELKVELRISSGKKYTGKVMIENFDIEFAQDDTVSFSTSLLGNSELVIVPE